MGKGSKEKNNIFSGVLIVVPLALFLTSNSSFAVQKIYFYHAEFNTLTSYHVGTWKGLGTGWKAFGLSSRTALSISNG
jgi:hypothetical protein